MNKPWILEYFLKELQDGFYVDINPVNDDDSFTKILDLKYRWRGIAITQNSLPFNRSSLFKQYVIDLDVNPDGFVKSVYENHPGSMLHYVRICNIKNLDILFKTIYHEDVEVPFSTRNIYPHLNFLCLEIVDDIDIKLIDQLYNQFDVRLYCKNNESNIFVNEVMSYLI